MKNLPETLHAALRQRALQNNRSINREAIHCLEHTILGQPLDAPSRLLRIRRRRETTPGRLTDQLIREARKSNRR